MSVNLKVLKERLGGCDTAVADAKQTLRELNWKRHDASDDLYVMARELMRSGHDVAEEYILDEYWRPGEGRMSRARTRLGLS